MWIIWLTILIDNQPIWAVPVEGQYSNYALCAYNAIDAKRKINTYMQDSNVRVDWECKRDQ